jgi:dTDP-4-dehydrorhamnose 3,5-epimerase
VRFIETKVAGAFLIEPEPIADERGFFARTWCQDEFQAHGLAWGLAQCSVSYSHRKGTLRGLHYQAAPYQEAKLVRCTRGAIWDVAVDLRPGSATHLAWHGTELTADNHAMLYIPQGCAHGQLTLSDDTEVCYQMSAPFAATATRGVRFDDPVLGIRWPGAVLVINQRDRSWPDLRP